MKLSTAVSEFMQGARVRLAWQTQQNYESDLGMLVSLAAVETGDSVLGFTPALVAKFFATLSKRGLKMATLHRRRATLNEFAKWGLRRRLWVEDPMRDAPTLKRPRNLPRPFSKAERARIMALSLPVRERCIRAMLYYTGLRVTPIGQIRLADIWTDEKDRPTKIRTVGKGNKEHWVTVVPELRDVIQDYLLQRSDFDQRAYIFGDHRPAKRKVIERMARQWGEAAGVVKCTPHRFRHTYATMLLERGAKLAHISKLMAHADISTTMLYTQVEDSDIEDAAMLVSDAMEGENNPRVTGQDSVPPSPHAG